MTTDQNIVDLQKEVHNQIKGSNEKFAYYIIALSVSCLGFSIYQTRESVIDPPKIILLLAVLSWAFSVYLGIRFIRKQQLSLLLSFRIYDNQRNKLQLSKGNPENMKNADKLLTKKMNEVNKQSILLYKWQLYTFFFGVVLYIIWHISQMYLNTVRYC